MDDTTRLTSNKWSKNHCRSPLHLAVLIDRRYGWPR